MFPIIITLSFSQRKSRYKHALLLAEIRQGVISGLTPLPKLGAVFHYSCLRFGCF